MSTVNLERFAMIAEGEESDESKTDPSVIGMTEGDLLHFKGVHRNIIRIAGAYWIACGADESISRFQIQFGDDGIKVFAVGKNSKSLQMELSTDQLLSPELFTLANELLARAQSRLELTKEIKTISGELTKLVDGFGSFEDEKADEDDGAPKSRVKPKYRTKPRRRTKGEEIGGVDWY